MMLQMGVAWVGGHVGGSRGPYAVAWFACLSPTEAVLQRLNETRASATNCNIRTIRARLLTTNVLQGRLVRLAVHAGLLNAVGVQTDHFPRAVPSIGLADPDR